MSISHKKIHLLTEKLNELCVDSNEENRKLFLDFMKETLKYDETKGAYDREHYEKYIKKYNETHREELNKKKAESAKKRYHQKKLDKLNSLNDKI
jgi:hypothetical protein